MDIKYLSDGRKVQIIGKLNSQEMIVQEIFVTKTGDEIPSGESFTTKSLHDEPVLSYKEKAAEKAEQTILKLKNEIKDIDRNKRKALGELRGVRDILKSSEKLVALLPEQDLDVFTSFITGTIEYLVVDGYKITPPTKMIDEIIYWEHNYGEASYDSIRLCSVLGRSNGILEYRINQYSDGSGHSSDRVTPFTNLEDALAHIKERAESKIDDKSGLSEKDYRVCIDMGILFSKEHKEKHKNRITVLTNDKIKQENEQIEKSKKSIQELEKYINHKNTRPNK